MAAEIPFVVGRQYTRQNVYDLLNVPDEKRRGNWETGYTHWGDDLYIFSTVGAPATGGYDYDNGWEGDVFRWFAKANTKLDQPQIQRILNDTRQVFVFTHPQTRESFTFEGLGTSISSEGREPVLIRWRIDRNPGETFVSLKTEEPDGADYIEGATHLVAVNAYERSSKAREACIKHHGLSCAVCGFNFASTYGAIGEGFIHVHHLKDLATVGEEYEVDPIHDLRPVCPNCHAMLHVETPAMCILKLREIVEARPQR